MQDKEYYKFLCENVNSDGVGAGDKKVHKDVEANLCYSFRIAVQQSCFRKGNGCLMAFNGRRYELVDKEQLTSLVAQAMIERGIGKVYVVGSPKSITGHILAVPPPEYRARKNIVSFTNKTLDINTMKTYDHDQIYETNIALPYDYDPKAKCPLFHKFLFRVLPDESVRDVIQEYCGAMFINRKELVIEKMLFLLGQGKNGKSVFLSTLTAVLGEDNVTSMSLHQLTKAGNHEQNIAAVNGMVANICFDMANSNVSGGEFKSLISGEPTPARVLYGDPFTARELPLMVASLNTMISSSDRTFADERRKMIAPFEETITTEETDPYLPSKLKGELSGIFNWLMEGRKRLIRNNGEFTYSAVMQGALERENIEGNSVLSFMRDKAYFIIHVKHTERVFVLTSKLYEEYEVYAKENKSKAIFGMKKFSGELHRAGFEKSRNASSSGFVIYKPILGKCADDVLDVLAKERGEVRVEKVEIIEVEEDCPF